MKRTITPGKPLRGTVKLPGDKSISHRAALFAALANGESRFENYLVAGVTRAMLEALSSLGVRWHFEKNGRVADIHEVEKHKHPTLIVLGNGLGGLKAPAQSIHCGNSATTLRLLAGALAAAGIPAVLDGSPGLRRRPMRRIIEPLRQMGVAIGATDYRAPIVLQNSKVRYLADRVGVKEGSRSSQEFHLEAINYTLPVASAQVKTCLLLAGLSANGPTTLIEPGPSRDHSERMLKSMGALVTSSTQSTPSSGDQFITTLSPLLRMRPLLPLEMTIPGDISTAAFLIVAALITPNSKIKLESVGLNPTRIGLLDALKAMGANIEIAPRGELHGEPVGDLTVFSSQLSGIEISGPLVVRMIDEFPIFAVAASYAQGSSVVHDATELRHKESDRITALCEQLRILSVDVQEHRDGFTINGGTPPKGGEVDPQGDHRLGMSLTVAGLAAESTITLRNAEIVYESFPGFKETFASLGAIID